MLSLVGASRGCQQQITTHSPQFVLSTSSSSTSVVGNRLLVLRTTVLKDGSAARFVASRADGRFCAADSNKYFYYDVGMNVIKSKMIFDFKSP